MSDINKQDEKYLLDHNYDGIKELDYPLPNWWLATFFITVIFAGVYPIWYHFSGVPSNREEADTEAAAIKAEIAKANASKQFDVNILNAAFADTAKKDAGKLVFAEKCAACHNSPSGGVGAGSIGPNLTDDYWINGKGTLADIAQVIQMGVAAKGMPTWGGVISNDDIANVTAYVKTLKGTNPQDAKAPQGDLVKE